MIFSSAKNYQESPAMKTLKNYVKCFSPYFSERLVDLKTRIEAETKISKTSQLIIYNNLLLESLVTEQQTIKTYPTIDRDHPLVLFSLNNTLCCDNNNVIKSSKPSRFVVEPIKHASLAVYYTERAHMWTKFKFYPKVPQLRCKSSPKSANEIVMWSKEACGSIHYIRREIYLVTSIIELLKLSAIAFK